MKEITAYQSDDGRIFRTVEECSAYEAPRIIEKYTNVDFCKRVEVRRRLKVIDRYLTVPGWKLEGFGGVHPRLDTPIFGFPWARNFDGFLSNIAIQNPNHFPTVEEWTKCLEYFCRQWVVTRFKKPGDRDPIMRIAKDHDDAMKNGMRRHYFELSVAEYSVTVVFDGYKKFKLTKL